MPKIPEERFEKKLEKFKADKMVIPENKKIIIEYLADCKRGMKRKKIGAGRRYKYLLDTPKFSMFFNKPFIEVTEKDVEKFLDDKKTTPYKRTVFKTFGKWLKKNGYSFPDVLDIDASEPMKEISSLTKDEIQAMADISKLRDQTILWFLFDTGSRAEEFLNVTHQDLTKKENADGRGHYYTVRFRHDHSKTKGRTISIPVATPYVDRYLKTLKDVMPSDRLFNVSYNGLSKMLKKKGEAVLNKHVWPHLLRHSSATYYVTKLNYGSFCYRFGWTITSKEPKRYVDMTGLEGEEQKTADTIQNESYLTIKKENDKLQEQLIINKEQIESMQGQMLHVNKILKAMENEKEIVKT